MNNIILILSIIVFFMGNSTLASGGYTKVLQINPSEADLKKEQLRQEEELKRLELEKLKEENKKLEASLEAQKLNQATGYIPYYQPQIIQYRYYPSGYRYGMNMGGINYKGFGFNFGYNNFPGNYVPPPSKRPVGPFIGGQRPMPPNNFHPHNHGGPPPKK